MQMSLPRGAEVGGGWVSLRQQKFVSIKETTAPSYSQNGQPRCPSLVFLLNPGGKFWKLNSRGSSELRCSGVHINPGEASCDPLAPHRTAIVNESRKIFTARLDCHLPP